MDINQIESLIFSEWENFYIDYTFILNIFKGIDPNKSKSEKTGENNIDNTLEEKLLDNNEQNEEEKKVINNNKNNVNNNLGKYIKILDIEKNKIIFFDDVLQNKRHKKRYEDIIEQLKYIEKNETIKIFKKQLIESLKNLYRDISNYYIHYLKVNLDILTDIIYPGESEFFNENNLINNDNENYQNLNKVKNEIKLFFEKAKEFNDKFLSQIKEQYIYYSKYEEMMKILMRKIIIIYQEIIYQIILN